jgi:hypothetical protein
MNVETAEGEVIGSIHMDLHVDKTMWRGCLHHVFTFSDKKSYEEISIFAFS